MFMRIKYSAIKPPLDGVGELHNQLEQYRAKLDAAIGVVSDYLANNPEPVSDSVSPSYNEQRQKNRQAIQADRALRALDGILKPKYLVDITDPEPSD